MLSLIKKNQYILISIILFCIIAFSYTTKLVSSYSYDSDFGRDLNDILQITRGHTTLIGPKLSFGGIHAGPYYYYLFAPVLKLSNYQPEALLFFNAYLFIATFSLTIITILKTNPNNKYTYLLGSFWIFSSPFMIFSARGPGNAFSYLPLLFLILLAFPCIFKKSNLFITLIFGFLAGIVINFHLINILIFFPLLLLTFFKKPLKAVAMFIGICIAFSPLAFFEIRHNFVQLRNTFIDKSYQAFSQNLNLNDPLPTSKNPITNFFLLSHHFSVWTTIPFLIILAFIILLFIKKHRSIGISKNLYIISSLLSFFILVFVARSQVAIHYFFPFILALQLSLIILISRFNYKFSLILLLPLIFFNIIKYPSQLFQPSPRNINEFRTFTSELVNNPILKNLNPKFNVFNARETTVAVMGWEYRYFLELNGYNPMAQDAFNQSNQLLIIQEPTSTLTVDSIRSWELDQFGPKKLVSSAIIGNRKLFLFNKITN